MPDFRGAVDLSREAHMRVGVDTSPDDIHHTLGSLPNQAAPGNHPHKKLAVSAGAITIPTPGAFAEGILLAPPVWAADAATGIEWLLPDGKAQAGIQVQQSGAYGTRMYLSTTDSFAAQQKVALSINEAGTLVASRSEIHANGWLRNLVTGVGWYNNVDAVGMHASGGYASTYPNGTGGFRAHPIVLGTAGHGQWGTGAAGLHRIGESATSGVANSAVRFANGAIDIVDFAETVWVPCRASSYPGPSSKKFKKNVKNTRHSGIKTLMKLNVVDFNYTEMADPDVTHTGLIAEELAETYPPAVSHDADGEPWGIDYGKLTPLIIKALQETIEESRKTIKSLTDRISVLEAKTA
jgi:hypothetical protein